MLLITKIAVVALSVSLGSALAQVAVPDAGFDRLLHDFETRAAQGKPGNLDELDEAVIHPTLEHLGTVDENTVAATLPEILRAANNADMSVRRLASAALYSIVLRPDGAALLSSATPIFTLLLTDMDTPIRRLTILSIYTLRPDASSPFVPVLENFLTREDAVSTIGPAVVGVLTKAAPNNPDSTQAVVQFMQRKDNTPESRHDTLQSILVVRPDNPEIAKEVAVYADDPDEQMSVYAIHTLQAMGKNSIAATQQSLARIAADTNKTPSVRAAATQALSAIP